MKIWDITRIHLNITLSKFLRYNFVWLDRSTLCRSAANIHGKSSIHAVLSVHDLAWPSLLSFENATIIISKLLKETKWWDTLLRACVAWLRDGCHVQIHAHKVGHYVLNIWSSLDLDMYPLVSNSMLLREIGILSTLYFLH